jgi:hypothetical protein
MYVAMNPPIAPPIAPPMRTSWPLEQTGRVQAIGHEIYKLTERWILLSDNFMFTEMRNERRKGANVLKELIPFPTHTFGTPAEICYDEIRIRAAYP